MQLSEYQEQSKSTASYPLSLRLIYPSLGLGGECGEVLNQVKKIYRDKGGFITEQTKQDISDELGDVLWYLAQVANDLDVNLDIVATENLKKLQSRKERGTIQGSGDKR